jgi:hypothetical protein
MATGSRPPRRYDVGSIPPQVVWTIVRGDTAAFKVYVTDDARQPLNIPDWNIRMDIERGGEDVIVLYPVSDEDDKPGEFTVSLTAAQSQILQSQDVFDIQLSLPQDQIVWTVAQGYLHVIEDVTEPFNEAP